MPEPEKCEAMDCDMWGRYTDPSLDGKMYCEYHRQRAMDTLQVIEINDLKRDREHWKLLAEKRGKEVHEMSAEINVAYNRIRTLHGMEQDAGNLLAVMHRDGGQYTSKYGWKRACKDAEQVRHNLMRRIDMLERGNRSAQEYLKTALKSYVIGS